MKILLISYDNGIHIDYFPSNLGYLASVLRNNNYDVTIYDQSICHHDESHLLNYLDNNRFDIVGIGFVAGYYQYKKIQLISKAINSSKNRPSLYILGGHGPTPEPEFFLKKMKADVVVMGEGEETIIDLLQVYSNNKSLSLVDGIAFMDSGKCIINKIRPLIHNLDDIPFPAYDMFNMEYYRLRKLPYMKETDFSMPVISGRGCKFNCNFCYRMEKGFRERSSENIVEEIRYLNKEYKINYIAFYDNLLMSSEKRIIDICECIKKSKLDFKWWCDGRVNFAKPDILKLMKESNCVFINYGIESFNNDVLKIMKKGTNKKMIEEAIGETKKANIGVGLNIIFGNINENKEHLKNSLDFLLKYSDSGELRTIRPVTPYPGTDLYKYAIKEGLLKDVEDFYENKHLNSDLVAVNFTNMPREEIHRELKEANSLLVKKYYDKQYEDYCSRIDDFYLEKNINFRGFRE
jgi:radical SAM superfamily enzyme YgiQ (UPF0313 family)